MYCFCETTKSITNIFKSVPVLAEILFKKLSENETFASSFCPRFHKENVQEGCKKGIKRINFYFLVHFLQLHFFACFI